MIARRRRFAALAIAVLAAVPVAGCRKAPPLPGPDAVARLGGAEVRSAEFSGYLERNLGEPGGGLESEALSGLFDQFLDEKLLARLATDRGLVAAGDAAASAVDRLLAAEPAPPITETAFSAYYAEHASDFGAPERVDLRVIRTDERVTADRARREILAGADFAAVARRLSSDPAAERGGDQGALGREDLPPAVAAMVFALPEGQVSNVVPADDGFRLFRVDRKLPARQRTLDEVREEILRRLSGARADRAFDRLLTEARSRYAVEVFDRNLPFAYKGKFPVARPYENR